jgi:two-component system, OmpR family, sensor histidine kinase KdpD
VSGQGSLRTFLGTAPGVGKTYAMLAEGRRRAGNGERVAVGWIDWHGRARARKQLGDLEVIAPRTVEYRGTVFTDFDAPAAIASGAEVVLVDQLAHVTADRTRQRWQDVADVLHAGLDVVTTMNVAHLASVRDYAARITGVETVAWVPDEFVRSGEAVLVDLPAQALRQRIAVGAVYSAEQVGGALAGYFRAPNLQALSELGRAWMAGTVDAVGDDLLARRGMAQPAAPPLVVAGDSGSSWGELVIRRAIQLARAGDAQLLVVHVQITDGLIHPKGQNLRRHRELTAELGGATQRRQRQVRRRRWPTSPAPGGQPPWWSATIDPAWASSPTARWPRGCAACSPEQPLRKYARPNRDTCLKKDEAIPTPSPPGWAGRFAGRPSWTLARGCAGMRETSACGRGWT